MDRRLFISAAAVLPIANTATASITPMIPAGELADPTEELFARWAAVRREWYRLINEGQDPDSPDLQALQNEESTLFIQMTETPALSLEGLLCLARLLWEDCGAAAAGVDQESRTDPELSLKRQILLSAEKLAGAPTWQPFD